MLKVPLDTAPLLDVFPRPDVPPFCGNFSHFDFIHSFLRAVVGIKNTVHRIPNLTMTLSPYTSYFSDPNDTKSNVGQIRRQYFRSTCCAFDQNWGTPSYPPIDRLSARWSPGLDMVTNWMRSVNIFSSVRKVIGDWRIPTPEFEQMWSEHLKCKSMFYTVSKLDLEKKSVEMRCKSNRESVNLILGRCILAGFRSRVARLTWQLTTMMIE